MSDIKYYNNPTQSMIDNSPYHNILGHLPLIGDRLPRNQVFSLLKLNTYDLPQKLISNYLVILFRDDTLESLLSIPFSRAQLATLKLYFQESYSLPTVEEFNNALTIFIATVYPEIDLDAYPSLATCISSTKSRLLPIKGQVSITPDSSNADLYKTRHKPKESD